MSDVRGKDSQCDYCGLPVRQRVADQPVFCCFGCRFAASVTAERGEEGQVRWTLTRLGLAIFFSMNVMVFTLALWTQDVYSQSAAVSEANALTLYELFRYLCLVFSLPVVLLLGIPLLENAVDSLRRRQITTDLFVVTAVIAAYVYSCLSVYRSSGHTYFEVACMVLVAVTLGRWLEATGKLKTTQALRSLEKLLPEKICQIVDGRQQSVCLDGVTTGDVVRVLPGERIPVDGVVQRNSAAVDEQIVSGESQPSIKEVGDSVTGGTLNLDGDIEVQVTAPPHQGTLQRLIEAVTMAAGRKARVERLADRLSTWFLPLVIVVATLTFFGHLLFQPADQALMPALAVLLIACPCALGIATPMALWAAMGRASRENVVLREADALRRLAGIRAICFDKTGTLTTGSVELAELVLERETDQDEFLRRATALSATSNHHLARAIAPRYVDHDLSSQVRDLQSFAGRGIVGRVVDCHEPTYLGSERFMSESGMRQTTEIAQAAERIKREGLSLALVGWSGVVRGIFAFKETLREQVPSALDDLRQDNFHLAVLTGDHRQRVEMLRAELQVPVASELLPDDKLAFIERTREETGPVAMVGDGINDAPALSAADVGIALGCGADVSRDAADVCLLGNDLSKIAWSIQLARRTMRTVRENLIWAFAYNSIGIALAAFGLLSPIIAAVAMVGSSLYVVSNSLRLAGSPGPCEDPRTEVVQRKACFDAASETEDASAENVLAGTGATTS